MAMASQRRRPFQRPPLSIRPPLSASENLPISDTRVPIDEVRSSNQVPMDDGSMSSSQMEHSAGFEVHKSVSEKRNLTWIDEMDNFLVDRLMEQMHKGQKIGEVFTKTAYAMVAREIGENFELSCNSEHIKNRMKTFKKNFYAAQEVLQNGSGFGFNESTQMIEATTEVWTTYTKAHPGASQLRHKPIRNYDKLSILLGKDRATGSLAAGAKERQLRWAQEQNLDDTIPLGSSQHGIRDETFAYVENEATTETSFSSADASVSAPKSNKETKKRKAKYADIVSEELRSIRVGMDAVVAALDRSNLQNHTEEQLFEEIAKVGGMSDVSHIKAYQALTGDVSAARAFLACPIDRRKLWLSVKFGPTFFDA
ncbi:uncharacterized protein At2g29880 isoform X2 [Vitis vinifera]|nr:uncharacterized protein At2g29880 isoform X2 [Vitis vinifera]